MKRIFYIIILVILFSLTACASKDSAEVEKSDIETSEQETDKGKTKAKEETEDKSETVREAKSEETEDDFQKGIPEEYRLKQNIPDDLDEPLPTSEDSPNSGFFEMMGEVTNMDGSPDGGIE